MYTNDEKNYCFNTLFRFSDVAFCDHAGHLRAASPLPNLPPRQGGSGQPHQSLQHSEGIPPSSYTGGSGQPHQSLQHSEFMGVNHPYYTPFLLQYRDYIPPPSIQWVDPLPLYRKYTSPSFYTGGIHPPTSIVFRHVFRQNSCATFSYEESCK